MSDWRGDFARVSSREEAIAHIARLRRLLENEESPASVRLPAGDSSGSRVTCDQDTTGDRQPT